MHDVKQIRKALWWGLPLSAALGAGALMMVGYIAVPMFQDIFARAPGVRIAPAVLLAPFLAVVCFMGMVVSSMRAIPCRASLIKRFEFAANLSIAASTIALLLVPVTSIAQRFYMPSIGYTQCHALQGQPTLWFTDWVRDPAWCVKGKSLDWVNEQARAPVPHGAP
ncbi:hypothetical protein [Paracidovorax avenae]|uniref:hypothetical protein n=1 Tax=Paracidovorax avenae TaxID=80867 RepID=UPI001AD84271|nr:hypothetical protein [Paracidovorax avenae]